MKSLKKKGRTSFRKLRRQWRARAAVWRQRHPILYLFRNHCNNARRRKKQVLWDYEEFKQWCEDTGHHILARDGYQIHRRGDVGPYCAKNCVSIPQLVNRRLQHGYSWQARYKISR